MPLIAGAVGLAGVAASRLAEAADRATGQADQGLVGTEAADRDSQPDRDPDQPEGDPDLARPGAGAPRGGGPAGRPRPGVTGSALTVSW